MDKVKEAFYKVKEDIRFLHKEIGFLKKNLEETRQEMVSLCGVLRKISRKIEEFSLRKERKQQKTLSKPLKYPSTHKLKKQTYSTHSSTHNSFLEPLKPKNIRISTGNEGVSTDRQTDRQTDSKHLFFLKQLFNQEKINSGAPPLDSIDNAAKILDSLDDIKKEIRLKFKRLTDQELLVFSILYQLDEEKGYAEYKTLAKKLKLTESSIRDYIGRLIRKGIPVEKKKINNKIIHLSISKNLKKIASLSTILRLRDL